MKPEDLLKMEPEDLFELEDLLEEAQLATEMIVEEMSHIFIPTNEIELCKAGKLPENYYQVKTQLTRASTSIMGIIIKVDKWKDILDGVEKGEFFFKRHMLALLEALRGMMADVDEARRFIREKTRGPLKMSKVPWYLQRDEPEGES